MPLIITPPAITPPAITPPVIELPVSIGTQSGSFPVPVPAVQPAAVQPAAIVVTDAQMDAALTAEGYTVTAPGAVVAPPPVVVPPPPVTTGTAWDGVYVTATGQLGAYFAPTAPAGALGPGGNYGLNSTLSQAVGATAADGKPALVMSVAGPFPQYPLSIPYPPAFVGNPSPNGTGMNLEGFEFFEYTIIPNVTIPAGAFSTQLFACQGAGTYKGAGAVTQDTAYPGNMIFTNASAYAAGVATTEKIPLSALGYPMVGGTALQESAATWAYKFAQQLHVQVNTAGAAYAIRSAGFTET